MNFLLKSALALTVVLPMIGSSTPVRAYPGECTAQPPKACIECCKKYGSNCSSKCGYRTEEPPMTVWDRRPMTAMKAWLR